MSGGHLFPLALVFFVTSVISVVTGSTSVITVPVMFQFGIDPRMAIATNMFSLVFMSAGGTIPFLQANTLDRRRLPALIGLTLIGSAIGAVLLLVVPAKTIPIFVSTAILGVAIFSTIYRNEGVQVSGVLPTPKLELLGYAFTFLLGIYGGLFSGGYVTILTAVFVAVFKMSFIEAIATTKLINVFSSGIATAVFMWRGLVEYRLGLLLGFAMFVGAMIGARYARRIGNLWLQRIYLAAVWILALKTLLFDVLGNQRSPAANPLGRSK